VSCTSSSACTALGNLNSIAPTSLAERWNGSSWTIENSPQPAPPTSAPPAGILTGVSCTSVTACVAVGPGLLPGSVAIGLSPFVDVEVWDGTGWTIQSLPQTNFLTRLNAVSCTAPSECAAVGEFALNLKNQGPVGEGPAVALYS
jgi:hypothetical protein